MRFHKFCPACGQQNHISRQFCWQCGSNFAYLQEHLVIPHKANTPLIATMWGLTAMQFCMSLLALPNSGVYTILIDAPALVMGIFLACSKNRTDKVNGYAKIGIEIVGFIVGLLGGIASLHAY